MRRAALLLPLLLLHLSTFSRRSDGQAPAAGAPAQSPTLVPVGVLIFSDPGVGKPSSTSIRMALSDFYAAHPNFTTRLDLRWRNATGDVVATAAAAVDLIKNEHVHAIVGPQQSGEAEFVVELGSKAQVPIISFSATSPSLSPKSTPYFIRTTPSDSSQSRSIAALIRAFGWSQAVPVYEDTEYGTGIIPYLIDAIKANDSCRVPYRSVFPAKATDDQIERELYKLMTMQSRVFVVHMRGRLAARVFEKAKEIGMMEKGYAWILTDGLMSTLFSSPGRNQESIQGVLGVRPYFSETRELSEFKKRWAKEYYLRETDNSIELNPYVIWAYDTIWALAMAVEKAELGKNSTATATVKKAPESNDLAALRVSASGPRLLQSILNTTFTGLNGEFNLDAGELHCASYEIVNMVDKKKVVVGYWSEGEGLVTHPDSGGENQQPYSTSRDRLAPVRWPGESTAIPKGWVVPMAGKKLRIVVPGPVMPGFHSFMRIERDPVSNDMVAGGFVIEVFEAAVKELPYAISWEYLTWQKVMGNETKSAGNYDDLMQQVFLQNFDAVVGDVTINANRSQFVDFTLPYATSGVSMVVPSRDDRSKNAWLFLRPLTKNLWIVSGAFFLFTGVVVWFLEHPHNDDFRGDPKNQLGTIFYFGFSTLVYAHREKVMSNLARIVVIVWLFVVLILSSSYTASLTSMLTVKKLRPTVAEIADLRDSGEMVGYLEDSFVRGLLVKDHKFDPAKLVPLKSPQEYADKLALGSKNGGVGAIVDEIPYLKVFLKDYCSNYTMTGTQLKVGGFGFVFPKGSPLAADFSRAILNITEGDKMTEIEKKWFGDSSTCGDQDSSISSNKLDLASFWGLFLITGVASTSALSYFILSFCYKKKDILLDKDEGSGGGLGKAKSMLKKFDERDPKARTFRKSARGSMGSPENDGPGSPCGSSRRPPQVVELRDAGPSVIGSESPYSISSRTHGEECVPPGQDRQLSDEVDVERRGAGGGGASTSGGYGTRESATTGSSWWSLTTTSGP